MADEEKEKSRPNSAASSKSSKSSKSDKSHKSDKSDKSHKSDKSDKSHKSAKENGETEAQPITEDTSATEEAQPTPAAEGVPPPAPADYKPEESAAAKEEVLLTAETEGATESKPEESAGEALHVAEPPAPALSATAEPEPAQPEENGLGPREKSVLDELTEEEQERFRALFAMYATDDEASGEKKLTSTGIKMLFRFMGEIVNEVMLAQWLKEEDKDVDGMFGFEEFCSLYKKKRQPEDQRREELLMSVNKLFPTNGSDDDQDISLDKVSSLIKHMSTIPGLTSENTTVLTDADVDDIIAKADVDKNKKISRQEFVNFLCSLE